MPRRRRAKVEELYRSDLDRYLFAPGYGLGRQRRGFARRAIDSVGAAALRLAAWQRWAISTLAIPLRSAARSVPEGGDPDPERGGRVG